MPGKGYVVFVWKDAAGAEVDFDALRYKSYAEAQAAFDALEKERGAIAYVRGAFVADLETLDADFLLAHTVRSLANWRAVPEGERPSFAVFLDFILPYRGSEEPVENWVEPLSARLEEKRTQLGPRATQAELRAAMNEDLARRARFDEFYYLHPTDQGFSELERAGLGRCEDLSNLQTYYARTLGRATACDYTPAWGHRDNNHAWTVELDAAGRGADSSNAHAAKVYRKTFRIQPGSLREALADGREPANRWLANPAYLDVTDQYAPTTDVSVEFERSAVGAETVAYRCVFNGGEWVAIHWARIEGGRVVFTKMGRNLCYLPAMHDGTTLLPAAPPVLIARDGAVVPLPGHATATSSFATTTTEPVGADSGLTRLESGTTYLLQRWDWRWTPLEEFVAGSGTRSFESLPSDALYWLVAEESRRLERIFTLEGGRQRFW